MFRQREKSSSTPRSENKYFDSEKKPLPSPLPFKLNGCSLITYRCRYAYYLLISCKDVDDFMHISV